jgi:hypothetical protein
MLCRDKVAEFGEWKRVFDSHAEAHRAAGLKLIHLWRERDEVNNVFFLFEVEDLGRAQAFISAPEAAKAGDISGVVEAEYHFLGIDDGY